VKTAYAVHHEARAWLSREELNQMVKTQNQKMRRLRERDGRLWRKEQELRDRVRKSRRELSETKQKLRESERRCKELKGELEEAHSATLVGQVRDTVTRLRKRPEDP
jgi:peptidoglycan hydrolase CwlO-like protein